MEFSQKVVMVTGSGRGIGRCTAVAYASQGARVIIAECNEEDGRNTENLIRSSGGEAFFYRTDVSKPDDIPAVVQAVEERFGRLDILINNAGLGRGKSPYELSVDDWDYVLNVNLRGTFLASREAAKVMKKNGKGSIVNIASTRGLMSEPCTEAYAASKGGILALTHALAVSLGPDGITVNSISPGWIETGDYDVLRTEDHLQHPAGRVGRPEDIARACLFLTNPLNDFITGENVVIDGGMTRKMIYEP